MDGKSNSHWQQGLDAMGRGQWLSAAECFDQSEHPAAPRLATVMRDRAHMRDQAEYWHGKARDMETERNALREELRKLGEALQHEKDVRQQAQDDVVRSCAVRDERLAELKQVPKLPPLIQLTPGQKVRVRGIVWRDMSDGRYAFRTDVTVEVE